MAKRLTHKTFLSFALMLLPCCLWAQQDTVVIRGHTFLFNNTAYWNDLVIKEVGVSRLGPGPRKWLMRLVTEEYVPDCNSTAVELGGYAVGDTTITFYTAWTYDQKRPHHPVGVRKQVYRVAPDGKVSRISGQVALHLGPPPCFDSMDLFLYDDAGQERDSVTAWHLFFECFDANYGARLVSGRTATALFAEVRTALSKELAEAYRRCEGFMRI